jgi:ABC-type branched-subunit amino acid transport system substrate-binding protein
VQLVKEDDQSDPATAAALVRKCVTQEHASFIFGPEETSTSTAAIPVANEMDVVDLVWESGWAGQGLSGSSLTGYAFPGIGNVFFADDLAFTNKVIVPRHYKRVAVIEDSAPGGLGNDTYTESLGKKDGFSVVASQKVTPGSTDDTPAVIKLLAAKPQAIVLGMIPGTDTITALKAIRSQDPTIPIGECSGCTQPSFIAAAGGYTTLKDVYMIGTPQQLVDSTPKTAANMPAITDTQNYLNALKAAGLTSADDLDQGSNGWDTGRELAAAITTAKSTSASAVRKALQTQNIFVGGLLAYHFVRTPSNYGNITNEVAAMTVLQPNGKLAVYNG